MTNAEAAVEIVQSVLERIPTIEEWALTVTLLSAFGIDPDGEWVSPLDRESGTRHRQDRPGAIRGGGPR